MTTHWSGVMWSRKFLNLNWFWTSRAFRWRLEFCFFRLFIDLLGSYFVVISHHLITSCIIPLSRSSCFWKGKFWSLYDCLRKDFTSFVSSAVGRAYNSGSWKSSTFIHCLNNVIAFLSPHGNGGRGGELLSLFLLLLYDQLFELEPQAPPFFSPTVIIACFFFKFGMITTLDLTLFLTNSFGLLVAFINYKKETNDTFCKCTRFLHHNV